MFKQNVLETSSFNFGIFEVLEGLQNFNFYEWDGILSVFVEKLYEKL